MADDTQVNEFVVITVVLEGPEISKLNSEFLAERIHQAINGGATAAINAQEGAEFRTCDGINILDRICIGRSG